MTRDGKRVTMADVAREAGVSKMTVSRVLNDKGEISEATRQRVLHVIEELGYRPHAQAQRLGTGESRTIALLYPLPNLGDRPMSLMDLDFIIGATAAAGQENYFFNLVPLPVTESDLLGMYRSAQIDGVILMQIHLQDWRVDLLNQHAYPFVMIGRCEDNIGITFIDFDFEAAVMAAFDHLVELGHRRIGFLSLPGDMRQQGYGPAVRSMIGYEAALHKHGLTAHFREVQFSVDSMFASMLDLMTENPALTAILTPHDAAVFGVLQALRRLGRRVPENFSVLGFATDKIAELFNPPLTTVRFPSYEMGYQASKMLITKLKGAAREPEQILVPTELIVRRSTALAP